MKKVEGKGWTVTATQEGRERWKRLFRSATRERQPAALKRQDRVYRKVAECELVQLSMWLSRSDGERKSIELNAATLWLKP